MGSRRGDPRGDREGAAGEEQCGARSERGELLRGQGGSGLKGVCLPDLGGLCSPPVRVAVGELLGGWGNPIFLIETGPQGSLRVPRHSLTWVIPGGSSGIIRTTEDLDLDQPLLVQVLIFCLILNPFPT